MRNQFNTPIQFNHWANAINTTNSSHRNKINDDGDMISNVSYGRFCVCVPLLSISMLCPTHYPNRQKTPPPTWRGVMQH